jgi:hypothetical protein
VEADPQVDGVVIAGVYGTGKSSVAAEIAETLERRGAPYGALDLATAVHWLDESIGVGIEDLTVADEGPIEVVAARILDWLGWLREV